MMFATAIHLPALLHVAEERFFFRKCVISSVNGTLPSSPFIRPVRFATWWLKWATSTTAQLSSLQLSTPVWGGRQSVNALARAGSVLVKRCWGDVWGMVDHLGRDWSRASGNPYGTCRENHRYQINEDDMCPAIHLASGRMTDSPVTILMWKTIQKIYLSSLVLETPQVLEVLKTLGKNHQTSLGCDGRHRIPGWMRRFSTQYSMASRETPLFFVSSHTLQ